MSPYSPLLITIRSTEDGYYRWELHDGPDGAFSYSGCSPLLERCFEDILRAQWSLADHLTDNLNPETDWLPHPPANLEPIIQLHTPAGTALPAQQHIPATAHLADPSTSIYPHPSKSG
jgi:hypothetical protein